MRRLGIFKIDKPLKDEDKWAGMTKKQLLYVVIAIAVCIYVFRFFYNLHLTVLGVVLDILIIVFTIAICVARIPTKNYLSGGGLTAEQLIRRLWHRRKKRNRKVYSAVVTNVRKQRKGVKLPFI